MKQKRKPKRSWQPYGKNQLKEVIDVFCTDANVYVVKVEKKEK